MSVDEDVVDVVPSAPNSSTSGHGTTEEVCGGKSLGTRDEAVSIANREKKVLVLGTPKGGATISAQTFFRWEGVYDAALGYDTGIHNYRLNEFMKEPNHKRRCGCLCRLDVGMHEVRTAAS